MIKIRLSRIGKNKHATFRVVVAEHARAVKGKALETLGSYDPHTDVVQLKTERVTYWLSKGAQATPTVHNLLVDQKIVTGKKVTAWKPPKKEAAPAPAASETTPAASDAAPAEAAPAPETAPAPTETPPPAQS